MKKNMKAVNAKILIKNLCFLFVLISVWVWLFNVTEQATVDNTYCIKNVILDIDVHYAAHRGTDKIVIHTPQDSYTLDRGKRANKDSDELVNILNSVEGEIEILVWEHLPQHILLTPRNDWFKVKQVVGIRKDGIIIWDVDKHNARQKSDRIAGIIGGGICTVIGCYIFLDYSFVGKVKKEYKRYKKKQKKKKLKQRSDGG